MSDLSNLTKRIDAEFAGFQKSTEQFQANAEKEYEAREARFRDKFVPAAKKVAELAKPRVQLLVDRFKNAVAVKPTVTEHLREVTVKFDSPLARVSLSFRLTHDAEVRNLVLSDDLEILPILMKFEGHSQLVVPLDKLDEAQITKWLDDRVVHFVQTVAAMHQNQNYLKGQLVSDPVAGVQLPKYAAKTTLEADGKTYYFISDETKREFEQQRKSKK